VHTQAEEDTVSPEPSVRTIDLSPQDQFLILASDGLWAEYSDQEAVDEVVRLRQAGALAKEVATALCKRAAMKRHADNTTVIVLFFHWGERGQ
jgi:serine/threonine protein phosphatase PrpC